jgi:DNA-binding MarR family transcriptional regulator
MNREERIHHVASHLIPRTALVTRLVAKQLGSEVPRADAGVLNTLDAAGPRRITDLAEMEGLAQPTMTQLVQKLEERGWVERGRHAEDGRVVVVSITGAGTKALAELRRRATAVLSARLEQMSDGQVRSLETATEALAPLIDCLQGAP